MDRTDRAGEADVLTRTVLSVEEYRAEVLEQMPSRTRTETVPVPDALGRFLAADAVAAVDVPHFRNSSMDGFAVRFADLHEVPTRLRVTGDVPAGALDFGTFAPGECIRVMTGGGVPDVADTIVPLEMTRPDDVDASRDHTCPDHIVVVERPDAAGAFVREVGSALPQGTPLASAGTRVTPGVVAALTPAGVAQVTVRAAMRVAIVSTGAELVSPGVRPQPGQVPDVNTHYLGALLQAAGADVTLANPLPDDVDAFTAAMAQLASDHDVVVVSGGASVGDHDVARMVLGAQETSAFRHVRMQPGKPQGWARWADALVVSLPGNPLSAAVSCLNFVCPLITSRMGGAADVPTVRVVAETSWRSPDGRRQFLPVCARSDEQGRLVVRPVHTQGSASHLTTVLAQADGFAVVPEDVTSVAAGDVLDMMRIPTWAK